MDGERQERKMASSKWECTDCGDRFYPNENAKEHRCPQCGGARTIPEEDAYGSL
jgi:predicted RNA-binding Zn-ribbon protein involved in translation (DUF1610 family)